MKKTEIVDKNYSGKIKYTRNASRGVIIREGKILVSNEVNNNFVLIPGGGVEGSETFEECCARELLEETGYKVNVGTAFAEIKEYYDDACNTTLFFECEITGRGDSKPTENEEKCGAVPEWWDISEYRNWLTEVVDHREGQEGRFRLALREKTALELLTDK